MNIRSNLDFVFFRDCSNCSNLSVNDADATWSCIPSASSVVSFFEDLRLTSCNFALAKVFGVLHIDSVSCVGRSLAEELMADVLSTQYLQGNIRCMMLLLIDIRTWANDSHALTPLQQPFLDVVEFLNERHITACIVVSAQW